MSTSWIFQTAVVGAGGFVGAVMRYGLAGWVHGGGRTHAFPWGTLAVNVTGCLLIGVLGGVTESRSLFSPEMRVFLFIGLLGGFTTFSTFGFETLMLLRDADFMRAGANIIGHLIVGLGAVWLGLALAKAW